MRKLSTLFATMCLIGCARSHPIVEIPPARCGDLIPKAYDVPVAAAPVPVTPDYSAWLGKPFTDSMGVALVAPWASAYVEAEGKQEIVQERLATTISIVRTCEAIVNAARPKEKH